ncbi:MAG: glycosyltransferase family 4 protein [Bacteroidota bacterium]
MKIGLVLPNIPAYSETFFRNKILGLQEKGHDVVLFVNNPKSKSNYSNCKVIKSSNLGGNKFNATIISFVQLLKVVFLNPKKSFELYVLNKNDGLSIVQNIKQIIANQFFLSQKLDWLHFGFGTMALGRENIAEVIVARMAVSFRGFDHYVYPINNKDCYKLLYAKKVKYHVLSEGIKRSLSENGVEEKDIVKITPAINLELFEQKEKRTSKVLQIKTVSRLHWIKGLDYTLDALKLLKDKSIDFHYTIIGDGSEKEKLFFAVHQLGLTNNVTFTGKLSPEKVKEQLETTDIYLQYSLQEGFCNAVLEAQAMGLLCVVSDAEGLSENVLDGVTGFVIPKRNPIYLANKIAEVYKMSASEKDIMTQNAITRVQTEFTLSKQIEKFIAFYESH